MDVIVNVVVNFLKNLLMSSESMKWIRATSAVMSIEQKQEALYRLFEELCLVIDIDVDKTITKWSEKNA